MLPRDVAHTPSIKKEGHSCNANQNVNEIQKYFEFHYFKSLHKALSKTSLEMSFDRSVILQSQLLLEGTAILLEGTAKDNKE